MHVGKAAGRDLIKCAVNVGGPGTTIDIDRRILFFVTGLHGVPVFEISCLLCTSFCFVTLYVTLYVTL